MHLKIHFQKTAVPQLGLPWSIVRSSCLSASYLGVTVPWYLGWTEKMGTLLEDKTGPNAGICQSGNLLVTTQKRCFAT